MTATLPLRATNEKSRHDTAQRCPHFIWAGLCMLALSQVGWFIWNSYHFFKNYAHLIVREKFYVIEITHKDNRPIVDVPTFIYENSVEASVWLALAGVAIFLIFIKTLEMLPKFWTVSGLLLLYAIFTSQLALIIAKYVLNDPFATELFDSQLTIYEVCFTLVLTGVLIYASHRVTTTRIAEVVKKISSAVYMSPMLLIYGFITTLLTTAIAMLTLMMLLPLESSTYRHYMILFNGIYIMSIFLIFGYSVVGRCATNWCRARYHKTELPRYPVFNSFCEVFSEKGAIILAIPTIILPALVFLIIVCTHKKPKCPGGTGMKEKFVKYWLLLTNRKLSLNLNIPEGVDKKEQISKIYKLINSILMVNFSFTGILGCIVGVACIQARILSMVLAVTIHGETTIMEAISLFLSSTMFFVFGFFGVVFPIVVVALCVSTYHTYEKVGDAVLAITNNEEELKEIVSKKQDNNETDKEQITELLVEKPTNAVKTEDK